MTRIVLLGPPLIAVIGVSTHHNQLFGSFLANHVKLLHFRVGSEERRERGAQKFARFVLSPFLLRRIFAAAPAADRPSQYRTPAKSYWRDTPYLLEARLLNPRRIKAATK